MNTYTTERCEKKTFTTHSKHPKTTVNISRKGSIVNERCKQLVETIAGMYPNRVVSDEDLVCLIERYIGADKETVRAYKGYLGHIRAGRCGDNRIVGLSRKGYLEKFGYLKKIPGHKWEICQTALFSHKGMTVSVVGSGSKEKISFSAKSKEKCEQQTVASYNKERQEEEDTEKDRFFTPKIYGELTVEEKAILRSASKDS